MAQLLIKNIAQIATPIPGVIRGNEFGKLNIIKNAAILIEDGIIKKIGVERDFNSVDESNTNIIDANGKAVVPGFVDSHSHLVFGGSRADEFAMRSAGKTYEEIAAAGGGIASTVAATRSASKAELKMLARERLQKALRQGITTMEIKSGYGLSRESERKILEVINELKTEQPIEITATFLGAHSIPKESTKENYLKEVVEMIPEMAELAEYCDVFCEKGYFTAEETRLILQTGLEYGLKPKIHTNQFHDIGGVEMALGINAVSIDHLEVLNDKDIARIADSDTVATVLPGVSYFLNIPYSPAKKLIDKGAVVALATDFNPGSSMTISMQLLMSMACTKMGMSVEEALCCATQNGAKALQKNNLGCIAEGYQADILLLNTDNFNNLAYFFGENHVKTVIKKGEVVWESNI